MSYKLTSKLNLSTTANKYTKVQYDSHFICFYTYMYLEWKESRRAHFEFADQWDRILLVNEVYQKHMNIPYFTAKYSGSSPIWSFMGTSDDRD